MFIINTLCNIGIYKPFKPSSLKWKWYLKEYVNTAFITLPTRCYIKCNTKLTSINIPQPTDTTGTILTGNAFNEGDAVSIYADYGNATTSRFKGFIKRINFKVPLEIECEGYSYLFRKVFVRKIWRDTTIKAIVQELVSIVNNNAPKLANGLPDERYTVTVSPNIPDIKVNSLPAIGKGNSQVRAIDVLDWMNNKMLQTVNFNGSELYVGPYALNVDALKKYSLNDVLNRGGKAIKHRLNWNVIKDDELLFNAETEFSKVYITAVNKKADGSTVKSNYSGSSKKMNEKRVIAHGITDQTALNIVGNDKTIEHNNKGYEGKITTFLEPYCEPNWASKISDDLYPTRSGTYFINGVEGSVSKSGGGRQSISIDFYLGN